MILQNTKIIVRIGLVVAIIMAMLLLLVLFEMKALNDMKNSLNVVVSVNNEKLILAQDMRFQARNTSVVVRNILLMDDQDEKKKELVKIAETEKHYREALIKFNSLETTVEGRKLLESLKEDEKRTRTLWRQIVDYGMAGDRKAGTAVLLTAVRSPQGSWLKSLDDMVALQKRLSIAAAGKAMQGYERTRMIMVIADCAILLVSAFLVVVLASSIVRPMQELARTVDSIAGGDLAARITILPKDEVGVLGGHVNRMAEQLQANEKELDQYRFNLEEMIEERTGDLNEQRKRFISVLIHDLKGPLVPIIGFSRKLISQKDQGMVKSSEYALAILDASMKLSATIDQISKNLRDGVVDHSFDSEVFDVEVLLRSVVKSFMPKAEAERLDIRLSHTQTDPSASDDANFLGDPTKIRTLLENLIGNAVKYARSKVNVSLVTGPGFLEFVVEDDGCGIAKEYLDKIFEEYFQVPQSKEGSGIGLYSAKRIVEHYKGEIRVEASDIGGARFTVMLPFIV